MRITHRMVVDTTVRNMRNNLGKLEKLQNQITSGQALTRPSDDPAGVARGLEYTTDIANGEVYLRTIDNSLSWLNATDSALSEGGDLLQRARELAVQGANGGAMTTADMQQIGAEIDQIMKQMIVTGNASLRGQRLFAGEQVDADPFSASATTPGYTYTGDTGQMRREYDLNAYVTINTPGQTTFDPSIKALFDLRNNLNAGNFTAVSSDIATIDHALSINLAARADVGAKMNRLEAAQSRQDLLQVNMEGLRSKIVDTDITEAISKFSIQETVYNASLQVGGKSIQPSLLDYLK
jgi:flagellar hook-associated protein 3 FlgL